MEKLTIGPSGNSQIFYDAGYKKSIQAPIWLQSVGLDGYEYSFGRGFTMGKQTALELGNQAKECGVTVSVHAPYFINFANPSDEMIQKSIAYVTKSLEYLLWMGGEKIVVHTGSVGKQTREEAILRTKETLKRCLCVVKDNFDMTGKYICLETMGKTQQIGTYAEIIDLCTMDDILMPTFDFGHINCIMQGKLLLENDYQNIFDLCKQKLGLFRTKNCHIHFSKIEYGTKGEIRHLDFSDTIYGPEFLPLAKCIKRNGFTPSIICESSQKMMEDALTMKKIYDSIQI